MKDAIYKWEKRETYVFSHIKQEIIEAPTLYNPYFNKDFLLYTFAYDTSLSPCLRRKMIRIMSNLYLLGVLAYKDLNSTIPPSIKILMQSIRR